MSVDYRCLTCNKVETDVRDCIANGHRVDERSASRSWVPNSPRIPFGGPAVNVGPVPGGPATDCPSGFGQHATLPPLVHSDAGHPEPLSDLSQPHGVTIGHASTVSKVLTEGQCRTDNQYMAATARVGENLMNATSDECCISGVCDWHNAINQGRPEVLLEPRLTGLCHEHGVWTHDDSGDVECCLCSSNPCDGVDLQMAVEHARIDYWRGQRDGIFLARQILSEAMVAHAPEPNPSSVTRPLRRTAPTYAPREGGNIDEPPF